MSATWRHALQKPVQSRGEFCCGHVNNYIYTGFRSLYGSSGQYLPLSAAPPHDQPQNCPSRGVTTGWDRTSGGGRSYFLIDNNK